MWVVFLPTSILLYVISLRIGPLWMHIICFLILIIKPCKVCWFCHFWICLFPLTSISWCKLIECITHLFRLDMLKLISKYSSSSLWKYFITCYPITNCPLHRLIWSTILSWKTHWWIILECTGFPQFFLCHTKCLIIINRVMFIIFCNVKTLNLIYIFQPLCLFIILIKSHLYKFFFLFLYQIIIL